MYGVDDFQDTYSSVIQAKTPIGYYITDDFFSLCIGNRQCFFALASEEIHSETGEILGDCCYWLPHIGGFKQGIIPSNKSKGGSDIYSKHKLKDEILIVDKCSFLPSHEKTDAHFFLDDNMSLKFGSNLYYTHPILNLTRTPLYWTLRWVRGIDKTRKLSKKSCICKSRDNLYTTPCINPWHYVF